MLKGWRTVILGVIIGIVGTIKAIATPEDAASAPTPEEAQAAWATTIRLRCVERILV